MSEITLCMMAEQMKGIYEEFTESVRALSSKAKGRSSGKMSGSFAHWIGGGHVTTDRERLSEQFLTDVQKLISMIEMAMEGAQKEEIEQACTILAETMMAPIPAKSDSTTDLMKRAMIGQIEPLLIYLPREVLEQRKQIMEGAYTRWNMLPVEKTVYKRLKELLK